jgi:AraC family transcriptional regulator, transcriptional activator of pobA
MLKYNPSLLREASLQLEQTVYSALREDRCRQDTPIVTNIINAMFSLLKVYFDQSECTCISQLVLCQLKAFFIGFHEYLLRNPDQHPDEVKSYRVRELFNRFMMLMERDYKISRDVNYYAEQMHITSKYLTNIVRQVTHHTPKSIIDQYVILQLKMQLKRSSQSIKEWQECCLHCRRHHQSLPPRSHDCRGARCGTSSSTQRCSIPWCCGG